MTPKLFTFCDSENNLCYVNLNNVDIIKFIETPNSYLKQVCIRYTSGATINYEVRERTVNVMKETLKHFM